MDPARDTAASQPDDEVDRIIAAWHRERPDLDLDPLAVISRLTRLGRHIDLARRAAFDRHGLESWEFDVLAALRRAGPTHALSPSALAEQTMVTSGTMTNRVDRLAARALVRRERASADRRGVVVHLTDTGTQVVDAAFTDLLSVEQALLSPLEPSSHAALAAHLRTLLRQFGPDQT